MTFRILRCAVALLATHAVLGCQELAVISCPSNMGIDTSAAQIHIVDTSAHRLTESIQVVTNKVPDSLALLPDSRQVIVWAPQDDGHTQQVMIDLRTPKNPLTCIIPIATVMPGRVLINDKGDITTALIQTGVHPSSSESGYRFFSESRTVDAASQTWLNASLLGESLASGRMGGLRLFYEENVARLAHAVNAKGLRFTLEVPLPAALIAGLSSKDYDADWIQLEISTPQFLGISIRRAKGDFKDYFICDRRTGSWVPLMVPGIMSTLRNMGDWFVVEVQKTDAEVAPNRLILLRRWGDVAWTHMTFAMSEEVVAISSDARVFYCTQRSLNARKIAPEESAPGSAVQVLTGVDFTDAHWAVWKN